MTARGFEILGVTFGATCGASAIAAAPHAPREQRCLR